MKIYYPSYYLGLCLIIVLTDVDMKKLTYKILVFTIMFWGYAALGLYLSRKP